MEAWFDGKKVEPGDRHRTSLCLADHLRYITDNDPVLIERILREVPFNYFADQNKEFVVRRRSTRYDECFRKLPDDFKTQQFMDCFGCSQPTASRALDRFKKDGVIESVKYGIYKKLVSELP